MTNLELLPPVVGTHPDVWIIVARCQHMGRFVSAFGAYSKARAEADHTWTVKVASDVLRELKRKCTTLE